MRRLAVLAALSSAIAITAWHVQSTAYASHTEQVPCQGTYLTETDNVGNGGVGPADADMDMHVRNDMPKHPIELTINASQTTAASLTIRAWGADQTVPEEVSINGNYVGSLSGDGASWQDTSFPIPASHLVIGDNLVEVRIDQDNGSGLNTVVVGCAFLDPITPVGGITELSGVFGDKGAPGAYGFVIGAATLALAATGWFALRRKTGRGA